MPVISLTAQSQQYGSTSGLSELFRRARPAEKRVSSPPALAVLNSITRSTRADGAVHPAEFTGDGTRHQDSKSGTFATEITSNHYVSEIFIANRISQLL